MRRPGRSPGAILTLALAGVLLGAWPSGAGATDPGSVGTDRVGSPLISAFPGSRLGSYAPPVLVTQPGDEITFVNGDVFLHSIRSKEKGPDDTSWCNPWEPNKPAHPKRNPRQFPRGKCPLLWTLPISATVGVVQTPLYGTENLEPGTTIEFYCTVFPNMRGTLFVN